MAHILLVEDSPTTRAILKSALEGKGYRVTEAVDAEQALELVQTQKPDLILLDLLLPGLDGWEACEQFRKMPHVKDIPIIMLTNQTRPVDKLRGWQAGADEYLFKNDDIEPLLNAIEKWLSPNTR